MNLKKVKEIVDSYKRHFHAINKEEIYKWRAVKHFQDNWNIDSENFAGMLENSLAYANNLLASGQYFPKRMIVQYAQMDSEAVRQLFAELYEESLEESKNLEDRWLDFHARVKNLNKRFFVTEPDKKSYQDHRAFMVYLALRFPENYFLFKFKMFKEFVEKIDFPYKPIKGRFENLLVYSELCERLREEIIKDEELIELHQSRLTENCYFETSYNILTQDIIYSTVVHFDRFDNHNDDQPALVRLRKIDKPLIPKPSQLSQKSGNRKIDYVEKQKINKRLGNFGEQLVFKYEQEKLKSLGSIKEPKYTALENDGAGYDILSYNEADEEIYIEVKTTSQSCETAFFITIGELKKSIESKEKYRLYRVYDYAEETDTAKFREQKGSLENLCKEPVLYKTSIEESTNEDVEL